MFVLSTLIAAQAVFRPASIFSDGVVLQREANVPVFGFASAGAKIVVEVAGQRAVTTASRSGRWEVRLNPMEAGGPFTMVIKSARQKIVRNVMVGEVWLCGGQSNMEWPVARSDQAAEMIGAADPAIRLFRVQRQSSPVAENDAKGYWSAASQKTVDAWSAVAYSFALDLRKKLKVPVGIIQATWGGTKCEAWMSWRSMESNPKLRPIIDDYVAQIPGYSARMEDYKEKLAQWEFSNTKEDPGNEGYHQGFADPKKPTDDWNLAVLPAAWERIEGRDVDGAVWYRLDFELTPEWAGKPLRLQLGQISDYDTTYFNNYQVGATKKREAKRAYFIGAGLVKSGRNTLAIRVWNKSGEGGVLGPILRLSRMDTKETIELEGTWKTKNELAIEAPETEIAKRPVRPMGPGDPNAPAGPYHSMISPLMPFGIRGVIWYQGEANLGEADRYRSLFPTLIQDWRTRWKQSSLPFFFVQLPSFGAPGKPAGDPAPWAEMRDAQSTALDLPNTGMVVTLDLGEPNNTHPRRKREVGNRLANMALDRVYGLPIAGFSARYRSHEYVGSSVRLRFENVQGQFKTADGGPVRGFQVAGSDKKWVDATAKLDGVFITLHAPSVINPLYVRYAWADFPDANLVNGAGLPVGSFRF